MKVIRCVCGLSQDVRGYKIGQFRDNRMLVGLRFILAKQNHINLRFGYAWGEKSHAAYISMGEAF